MQPEARFVVEDLFSLVDVGVVITGRLLEGRVVSGMRLMVDELVVEVVELHGEGGEPLDDLDVAMSQSLETAPGVVVSGASKEELMAAGVFRGEVISFGMVH